MSRGILRSLTRRGFVALLPQSAALWAGRVLASGTSGGADRGLGGTGAAPTDPAETLGQDRGIGGTGVIGTIQRFGSVVVNDLRVAFPPGVPVTIDGRSAAAGDLRVGHVVRMLARSSGEALVTRAIVAESEVVGPVESRGDGRLVVLGQRVVVPSGVAVPAHRAGDHLAVSGLRRLDGTVVASLVELRPSGLARLRGPVALGADGRPAIGGLVVPGLDPALLGRRVSLVGTGRGESFQPSTASVEPRVPFAAADAVSLEAYVERAPDGLLLGSGLKLSADAATLAEIDEGKQVRAVVTARTGAAGRLEVLALRIEREHRDAGRRSGSPAGQEAPESVSKGEPSGGAREGRSSAGSGGSRGGRGR